MRKWTRKNSLSGLKLRSEMDEHEATVLRSLIGAVSGLLSDRAADAPEDELAALTGLRTGNSTPPDDPQLLRLLPDFHRAEPGSPDAKRADLNAALRSLHEPEIIDAKLAAGQAVLDSCPELGGKIVLTPSRPTPGWPRSPTSGWRWARCSTSTTTRPTISIRAIPAPRTWTSTTG
ncbi:Domain of uncharacterised function (DUF2017) [Nocardia asteroides]|nr:Domain of uncharacterised function (DUF2017) [Nocardia asteroides]